MKVIAWCKLPQYGRISHLTHLGNVRCIFSKTGVWKPKLQTQDRLEIEDYWRDRIKEHDREKADELKSGNHNKPKFYALSMFPYPSGNLHLGHVRVYTISDVMARYHQAQGKAVLHPMGWDAFGLPAENAAIERGIRPKDWTYSNIKRMKEQLHNLGLSFDWSREIATCDPAYYKWTQWIFLKMFENGLAFQKKGLVNWDPIDMTVLANEQIDENGCSWRSGARVEQKYLTQWYLRTTVFSQSLSEGLDEVDPSLWRDIIKLQKNWISDCKGHRIQFKLVHETGEAVQNDSSLTVYTEDADLVFGVSHVCLKPSHHLCVDLGIQDEGAVLPIQAVHPLTGQLLSLVVTDNEEMYPNQQTMLGIPTLSEKAKVVAEKHAFQYKSVLDAEDDDILVNSGELSGLSRKDATVKVQEMLHNSGAGGERVSERLDDWLISRQRYWGTPIPIIHCSNCGVVPVPYEDLPVELPDLLEITTKSDRSPLAQDKEWLNTTCPRCGNHAERETDTMDTFVDSTWYFLRYLSPHCNEEPFSKADAERFMPVDLYVGGKEHAVLHLYFARFVCHFLHSVGLLPHREPFVNLLTQGMVKGQSYRTKTTGKYLSEDQVDLTGKKPVEAATGVEVIQEYEKMSKSKYNGVDPEDVLKEFGVDSTRLCIVSNVSPQTDRNWSNDVYKGVLTWQGKVWTLVSNFRNLNAFNDGEANVEPGLDLGWEKKIDDIRNHIINNVNFQMNVTFRINSAISRLHSYSSWLSKVPNEVSCSSPAYERALADLIVMTSPIAPHFASELWAGLRNSAQFSSHDWGSDVLNQNWPSLDEDFMMPLLCRVNNIDICEVGVPYKTFHDLTTETALTVVQEDPTFQRVTGLKDDSPSSRITKPFLNIENGYKAMLSLQIPGLDFGLDNAASASQKSKQAKKIGKKKKKLHTME